MIGPQRSDPNLPVLDGYVVQRVPGARAGKDYRCPACHGDIPAGQGHVVVWPDGMVDERRHWHHHCWRLAVRRGRIA
ncbi:MAG: hypothetical protein JJT89_00325 [Nitriliruptoraceae bacterium]|nr:hypothetical protein [Nitriliruptoraceae bacterium]